jgi:hypothetical protein
MARGRSTRRRPLSGTSSLSLSAACSGHLAIRLVQAAYSDRVTTYEVRLDNGTTQSVADRDGQIARA